MVDGGNDAESFDLAVIVDVGVRFVVVEIMNVG